MLHSSADALEALTDIIPELYPVLKWMVIVQVGEDLDKKQLDCLICSPQSTELLQDLAFKVFKLLLNSWYFVTYQI